MHARKINRRNFMHMSSACVGSIGITGVAAATNQEDLSGRYDILVENITIDGSQYTASVCHDKKSEESEGVIIPSLINENEVVERFGKDGSDDVPIYSISDDVVEGVISEVLDMNDELPLSTHEVGSTESSDEGVLWEYLLDESQTESDEMRIQSNESVLERALQNISDGMKESLHRIGVYYIESPDGTNCDATVSSHPHRQLGASIDHHENVNEWGGAAIGTLIGGIVGAMVSGGTATALLGAMGTIAGFAIGSLRNTSELTVVFRDGDHCLGGICEPQIKPYVSGVWMDKDTDLLTVNGVPDFRNQHLGNAAEIDTSFEDTTDVL